MKAVRILELTAVLLLAAPAMAKDGFPLMQESDRRTKAGDETIQYNMELYEGDRLSHSRKLIRYDKQIPVKASTVVRFSAPVSVKNVSLLIEDTGAPVNDIWSYTPSTKNLRRISGAQKQNWFMGTEFTYEDFEDFKLKAYQFTEISTLAPCLAWTRCTVVEAIPKPGAEAAASGYSKKRYFIEGGSFFPVQVEYFNSEGKLGKRLMTEGLKKYGAYYRPTSQTMVNLENGRKTRMTVTDVAINSGLSDSKFTQRSLRSEEE
jgi:hypothetical protein